MTARSVFLLLLLSALVTPGSVAQNIRSAVSLSGTDLATCTVSDPCRTFDVAMSRTNTGGEVIVLSSAGYGPFTVTKSVSVISPPAFHAAIAPTAGAAITVNAPDAVVVLRGIYLNSGGAATGISVSAAKSVHIANFVIHGFGGNGIEVLGETEVFVKDSEIRHNNGAGIFADPISPTAEIIVDAVTLERNGRGVLADSGVIFTGRNIVAALNFNGGFVFRNAGGGSLTATVENSVSADSSGDGFVAQDGAHVTVRNSVATRNFQNGFVAFSSTSGVTTELVLDHCLASEQNHGVVAGGLGAGSAIITISHSTVTSCPVNGIAAGFNGTVRAFGNTVTRNGIGFNGVVGTVESGGHNLVKGNTTETDGTITTVPPI